MNWEDDEILAGATTDGGMPLMESINFNAEKYGSTTEYSWDSKNGFKYIQHIIESPKLGGVILPYAVMYENIGDQFLDAFINRYNPIRAYLLNSGHDWNLKILSEDDDNEHSPITIHIDKDIDPKEVNAIFLNRINSYYPEYMYRTKQDALDDAFKFGRKFGGPHTHLSMFNDDVDILAKSLRVDGEYMYFSYCMDNKLSSIGRFFTEDPEEEVIKEFDRFVHWYTTDRNDSGPAKLLPDTIFCGWISW